MKCQNRVKRRRTFDKCLKSFVIIKTYNFNARVILSIGAISMWGINCLHFSKCVYFMFEKNVSKPAKHSSRARNHYILFNNFNFI